MLPETIEDMRYGTLEITRCSRSSNLECADCGNVIRVRLYDNGEMQFQCAQCPGQPFKVVGVVSPDVVDSIPSTLPRKSLAQWNWCGTHDWMMERLRDHGR